VRIFGGADALRGVGPERSISGDVGPEYDDIHLPVEYGGALFVFERRSSIAVSRSN